jgi:hypothetical protein
MLCEHHKDTLIEAAASGAAPSGELRAHLAECASCRAAFAEEQSLFAAIDSSLHTAANAEVPTSLLPRVRASLDEVAAPQLRWVQPLILASASAALVFLIVLLARPHRVTPENVAKQGPISVPASVGPEPGTNPGRIPPVDMQIAAIHTGHTHAVRNSTNLHSAASSNPEVLVPPDEREAFARLVAALNERGDVGTALLSQAPEKKDALVSVAPLKIPDLEIKPLEGRETEASQGREEKR